MPDLDVPRAGARGVRRRAWLVVVATVVALAAIPSGTLADTLADRQAEADAVEAELAALDHGLERAVEAYNVASGRLQETEANLAENTRRLEINRDNLAVAQVELNEALVRAYRHGDADLVQVLLGADSLSAVLDEVDLVNRSTQHSARVLERVRGYRREIDKHQAALAEQELARRQALAERAERRAAVEQGLADRQARLDGLNDEIRDLIEARARAEQAEARRRAQLASAALDQAAAVAATASSPAIGGAAGPVDDGTGGEEATVPAPPPSSSVGASAAGIAMSQLGVPYVWAGASPSAGFDCSGLIMWAYGQLGVSLPHNAAAQFGTGVAVERADLQPGDLVFFNGLGHSGIYIGGGQYVHAPQTGDVVKVSPVDRGDYVGARRVG